MITEAFIVTYYTDASSLKVRTFYDFTPAFYFASRISSDCKSFDGEALIHKEYRQHMYGEWKQSDAFVPLRFFEGQQLR